MRFHKKQGRADETPKMRELIFRRFFLYNIAILLCALCLVLALSAQSIIRERGLARVELLQQISDSNADNRNSMQSVMNYAYEELCVYPNQYFVPLEQSADIDTRINAKLADIQRLSNRFGFDYTISIVLNNKTQYSAGEISDERLKVLLQSYWYIKHFMGESDTSWSLRFPTGDSDEDYGLCYARTIYGDEHEAIGVMILNASPQVLLRTYQKAQDSASKLYILDQNGIVISHSNPSMIGMWLNDMKSFHQKYEMNTYCIASKANEYYLISNYYDAESGWTIVEEQPIGNFIFAYSEALLIALLIVSLAFIISIMQGYSATRRLSRPLIECTDCMRQSGGSALQPMPEQWEYEEIHVLSSVYNSMRRRIEQLIIDMRKNEQEKRKTECDFLQAQIDPHFMHNTLLAIRSLIAMGRAERAQRMLEAFIEFLKVPLTIERQYVPLSEELSMIENYISIMEYRFNKQIAFHMDVSDELQTVPIPRMLLEPIIGNSIFHGFGDLDHPAEIWLSAHVSHDNLCIIIRDNGEGMSPERLETVRAGRAETASTHHGIGLPNVRKRIQILYGKESKLQVDSVLGQGTSVTAVLCKYSKRQDNPNEGILDSRDRE